MSDSLEVHVGQEGIDALLLDMTPAEIAEYDRRLRAGQCLVRRWPGRRFVPGRPETYWDVCVTHGKVADVGHHVARGGSSD